jgi:hypothetical protein
MGAAFGLSMLLWIQEIWIVCPWHYDLDWQPERLQPDRRLRK